MDQYVGVSLKQTWISVRQNRKRIWRGKCLSHPRAVAEAIRQHAPDAVLVVFETGSLSTWFHHDLTAAGLPAVCIDARHAKAALDTAPNKTDANDANGLSLLAEVGFFREVRAGRRCRCGRWWADAPSSSASRAISPTRSAAS